MRARASGLLAAETLLLIAAWGCGGNDRASGDFFYRIETGNVQSGYAVLDTSFTEVNGERFILLEFESRTRSRAMGSDIDTRTRMSYLLDPGDKHVLRAEGEFDAKTQSARWTAEVSDNRITGSSPIKGDGLIRDMPPDAVIDNILFFDRLVSDLMEKGLSRVTYPVLDPLDFEFRETRYEKAGEEVLELNGRRYPVMVVDQTVEATGVRARLWIDTSDAMVVKVLQQDGNVITRADPAVVAGVGRADLDKYLFNKTNVAIADVSSVTYMKVRAKVRPIGMRPTLESLNIPGQAFTGVVEDNLIDGVFEIEHRRFDGTGSPGFPAPPSPPDLEPYLAADGVFETGDPVLIERAREITAGSRNAWEAATRLARWVSDEIAYAVPGGGTARRTYDLRAGECGAHSVLLATFCRAVGIPARVVWGCMYVPEHGGSFGQHGWTEVHMGEAGWIPVDATVGEADFLDSSHIRVGELASTVSRLNGQEFEVLDYRLAGKGPETAANLDRYRPFCGTYRHRDGPLYYKVKIMDGRLVIEVPGKVLLALEDPDERGRWFCRLAGNLYATFDRRGREGGDEVTGMVIHERMSLPRSADSGQSPPGLPDDLAPYPGIYHLAAAGKDFEILWKKGSLALRHPLLDKTFALKEAGDGVWRTKKAPYVVSFARDTNGNVTSMNLEEANTFVRKSD